MYIFYGVKYRRSFRRTFADRNMKGINETELTAKLGHRDLAKGTQILELGISKGDFVRKGRMIFSKRLSIHGVSGENHETCAVQEEPDQLMIGNQDLEQIHGLGDLFTWAMQEEDPTKVCQAQPSKTLALQDAPASPDAMMRIQRAFDASQRCQSKCRALIKDIKETGTIKKQ